MNNRTCSVCGDSPKPRAHLKRGMCGACYQRFMRHGFVTPKPLYGVELFWSKVDKSPSGCWNYLGFIGPGGYGRFGNDRASGLHGTSMAHRIAYIEIRGQIPEGLVIDHLCRNRRCVNPLHMEPVTNGTNVLRGMSFSALNAVKTRCPQGHEYDYAIKDGRRACRKCRAAGFKRWYDRTRAGTDEADLSSTRS